MDFSSLQQLQSKMDGEVNRLKSECDKSQKESKEVQAKLTAQVMIMVYWKIFMIS